MNTTPLSDGAELARSVIDDLVAGRWQLVSARFDQTMRENLSDDALAAAWAQIVATSGAFESHGDPVVTRAADVTITSTGGAGRLRGTDIRSIVTFVVIAFALAWLVALPLWLGDGLASPAFPIIAVAMMATPTLAALTVEVFVERPPRKARTLGPADHHRATAGARQKRAAAPDRRARLAAAPRTADGSVHQPGPGARRRARLARMASSEAHASRGDPRDPHLGRHLGTVARAAHPSRIQLPGLLGWLGLSAMTGMCIVFGAIFGWLRLRSDSLWPAALAHAAFNGAGGTYLLFAMAGERIDTTQATVLGWSGWIVPLALVIVLVATGRFRRPSPAPLPDERSTTRATAETSSPEKASGR